MPRKIHPYNPILKERARQLRKTMTRGEVILWQHLRKKQILGVSFLRQRPIDQFIVDFYCKDWMLAIEIDGSSHDSLAAQERDAYRQAKLEALGVSFLRFSEYDAQNHPEAIVETITEWLLAHPKKSSLEGGGRRPEGAILPYEGN
ncbi:DNA methylase [Picosynechococcus sp. PCC 7003]|nr:DNA methylase [Picosynechococcus sp. PCC 7003]